MHVTGRARVEYRLEVLLKLVTKLNYLYSKPTTVSSQKRISSILARISKGKKELVFLSVRARDPITRFFASNALKEVAQAFNKTLKT
ncbi:MAG: hypothetical protein NTY48_05770 [Candidatus Diapherotrites archaeon]|nr:hypothetical protein [Candidatus Diapherotrites archaeon]